MANRARAQSVAALETLLSDAPVGFGFVDCDLRVRELNDRLAAIGGSTAAAQRGHLVADVLPALWTHLEPLIKGLLAGGAAVRDLEVSDSDRPDPAAARHWQLTCLPVVVAAEIVGVDIVVVDVTAAKGAEDERRRLAAIVDGSGDAIFGATVDGIVTSWNDAAERLFGFTAAEIIGQPIDLIAPTGRADEQVAMRALLALGGSQHFRLETVRRRKDGSLVEVLVMASTATDEAGNVVGLSVIAHDITERRGVERALLSSEGRLAEAQRVAQLGSFEFDLPSDTLTWSAEYYRLMGVDPAVDPTRELFVSLVHPEDRSLVSRSWLGALDDGLPFDLVFRIIRADTGERTVRARGVAERGADGAVVRLVGTTMDDTERLQADRVRRAAEVRFEIGFEQAGIGAIIADLTGLPLRVNSAMCAFLGRTSDELVDRSWGEFAYPGDVSLVEAVLARVREGHDTYTDERRYVRPDGAVVWASSHVTLARDDDGEPQYYFVQLKDITERKQMESELAHQALHDSLTGLPNRALLTDRIDQGLAGSRRRRSQLGVIFLDLDHFKEVNDSFGHSAGDVLLAQAAKRIIAAIRSGDTVARFGGDEFVVVCNDVSALAVEQLAERVLETISLPYEYEAQELKVTASVGVALADADSTPESLLRDSDAAMYRAKDRGRARVEIFDEGLRSKIERQLATTSALRRALEHEEFVIAYQPIVDLTTGEMVSVEALLRWNDPERGIVGPDEFISQAEETGLIVDIGAWVLRQACSDLAEWTRAGATISLAVNVSVRQLTAPDLVSMVAGVLAHTGVAPERLSLELTESVFMEDVDYFGTVLARVKDLGVRLSIDDFGTGYSSLSYLKRFPVDAVKVDRSFVDGLGTDVHDTALVAAIIAMADALDLEVTAEGVETAQQLHSLKLLGSQRAQGYFLARPMPAAALVDLLTEARRWPVPVA